MKNALSIILFILFIFWGCSSAENLEQQTEEKAQNFADSIISLNIPDGYTYKAGAVYLDSIFTHPIFLPDVFEAATNIQELRKDLEKCNTHFRDSIAIDFIKETKKEIINLQQYIRKRSTSYMSGDFCGWNITFGYNLFKGEKDSLVVIDLIADKDFKNLLIDDIMTRQLSQEYEKLRDIIDESLKENEA